MEEKKKMAADAPQAEASKEGAKDATGETKDDQAATAGDVAQTMPPSRSNGNAAALGSPVASSAAGSAAATTSGAAAAVPSSATAPPSSAQEFVVETGEGDGSASARFQVQVFSSLADAQRHGEEAEPEAEDEQVSEMMDLKEDEEPSRQNQPRTQKSPPAPPPAGRFSDDEDVENENLSPLPEERAARTDTNAADDDDGTLSDSSTASTSSTISTSSLLLHPQHKHAHDLPQCILAHDWYEQQNDQPTWLVLVKWKSKPVAECSWEAVNSRFFAPDRSHRVLTQYVNKLSDARLRKAILRNSPPPPRKRRE